MFTIVAITLFYNNSSFYNFAILGGLLGAGFVSINKSGIANAIWTIVNVVIVTHNLSIGQTSQAILFMVYEIYAIFGTIVAYNIIPKVGRFYVNNIKPINVGLLSGIFILLFFNDINLYNLVILGGILGASFVSIGNANYANMIWSVANIFIIIHNINIGEIEQAILFASYEVYAIFGLIMYIDNISKQQNQPYILSKMMKCINNNIKN